MFPDNPRPNSKENVWQATYQEVPVLPPRGTAGQVLTKESNLDYDVYWKTLSYLTDANNGLSLLGSIVQLGGILIKNTSIDGATFNFTISNLGTFISEADNYIILANNALQLRTPNVINTTATSGQVLKLMNAASGNAEWADEFNYNVSLVTATHTISSKKELVVADTTSTSLTVNLNATPVEGDIAIIKKIDNSVNTVTITPGAGHTIDDASAAIFTIRNQSITLIFDGVSTWIVTSKYL